jgi:hypothetical protein
MVEENVRDLQRWMGYERCPLTDVMGTVSRAPSDDDRHNCTRDEGGPSRSAIRIVFSIVFSRQQSLALLVYKLTKSRRNFYTQIRFWSFHTA